MNMTKIGFLGVGLLVATACGRATPAADTPQAPPPAVTVQNAALLVRPTTPSLPTPIAIEIESLIALLPESSGWTRSTPTGKQLTLGVPMSFAQADYDQDDRSIKLEITDSALNQLAIMPLSTMMTTGFYERTIDGYKKAIKLGASPGFESWENELKEAQVTVIVNDRFIVTGRGRNVDNVDVVRALVQAVDLSKLAGLR